MRTAPTRALEALLVLNSLADRRRTQIRPIGLNVRKLDHDKLLRHIRNEPDPATGLSGAIAGWRDTEQLVEATTGLLRRLCDASMPRKQTPQDKEPKYCAGRKALGPSDEYKQMCKTLRREINRSQDACWTDVIDQKLGMNEPPVVKDEQTMGRIVDGLFPTHPEEEWPEDDDEDKAGPEFTGVELGEAVPRLAAKKAPGPDGIPAEVLRVVASENAQSGFSPCTIHACGWTCLAKNERRHDWSSYKKKGLDPDSPSSYRPLCLFNTRGTLFELLLRPRIQKAVQDAGGLHDRQYGFRKGRSTIDAIRNVVDAFDRAQTKPHKDRPIVLLATLDVRNVFNSARWKDIVGELTTTFRLPPYLRRIMKDYMRDRTLTYQRETEYDYDGILRIPLAPGVHLVAYADDVVIVIVARDGRREQLRLNRALGQITD
ncbi:uncharacterized protein LOC132706952 [Cylas formicarius]|uniref:uncharacterized protein LOC132706952 n=1 Tax=Cylas formicarius TaxID=197179 RepID=UPI00295881D0|nr:uncharacterized protein LOC132706952 [Cylas formicarius]